MSVLEHRGRLGGIAGAALHRGGTPALGAKRVDRGMRPTPHYFRTEHGAHAPFGPSEFSAESGVDKSADSAVGLSIPCAAANALPSARPSKAREPNQ